MTDITENCENSEVTYSFTSNSNTSSDNINDNISEKSLSSTSEFSEINDEYYLTEYF
tara:strand:+ start:1024 stop:1194 length:171 start_codon:yes stop_codon:yes gene_type:complete